MSILSLKVKDIINPPFFGIDISDLTIKFLKVGGGAKTNSKKIDYFGEIKIEPGIVTEGEIKKEKELAEILKNSLKDSRGKKIPEKFVVASLPEEKSFVRIIRLPRLKKEEVDSAVRWELEGNIPLPIEQAYYDYEIISAPGPADDHIDVLITVFPRIIVDSYAAVLKDAGFSPIALELESQAISRATINENLFDKSVIIIDIGMTRSSFIIFGAGSIVLTLSIALGGRNFNNAIAEKLGISPEDAEKLKKEHGLDKNYKNGVLIEALAPMISALIDQIKKQSWYYKEHSGHIHGAPDYISKIILVGGDANLVGLEKYISVAVKKPVVAADPFTNIYGINYKNVPPIPKNTSLKYTTCIGLALRK